MKQLMPGRMYRSDARANPARVVVGAGGPAVNGIETWRQSK